MNIRRLSLLGSVFLSGLLTLGACGSSSSSGTGGTTGSVGGSNGTVGGHVGTGTGGAAGGHIGSAGGSTGTGAAGGASGACSNLPPCLTFIGNCAPSGTCVMQTTGTVLTGSQTINTCYSNGVKSSDVTAIDLTTGSVTGTATYSKSGVTCFTETVSISGAGGAGAAANETATIKNGTGATVATLTPNADGTVTVNCTGGSSYVVTDNTCMPSGSGTTSDCTDGVCQ